MEPNISLHSKLSSIMETMAESAMAELCKAVDEDTVELRLELSRLQTLNSALTEKVDTLECELTAARSDAPGLLRSHRTVAIQTDDDDVNESESPVINGVFGKDWCLNLWKDRFRTNQKIDAQQVDDDMNASMPLESFSPIDVPVLEKGAEFYSFESFSEAIESWQRSNFVELYKRSSRTVENAKKRARKKSYSENLVFAELDFACAHGSKGPDVKRCPFTIKVRVTPDGRKLYIKDISPGNCHNHELSQAVLTGSDPEHVDVIQVKVEDYLEGAGGSFAQETLSQENDDNDDERFSEEVEQTPAWLEDMSLDSDSKNHYDNNGTEEQSVQSSTGTEDDCYEYVIEDGENKLTVQASSSGGGGGKKYICLRCNIVFYNPNTLMIHQRAHQPYWCDVCKEQFGTKSQFKHHKCDLVPNKCRLCGKTWASQSALRTHMVVHTGDKRFVCRFCGQRFAQKGSMRSHLIRSHMGCGECGMTFDAKTQLLHHLLKHKMRAI
ncbi:zinc finger and BTB domain-containing protein 24 isoform X2 [Phyllopteryx taeniolatus]|uniref:zinc finger and BTB domain-containing protein 24 isoform X2 n=1 Tax=Phyllopteryx taeniolatus TaxID=161469 RepID=UPI002AD3B836|nr:zinc finger and BTB domain-containing protein 24 isoform X2 [Phyllopteryx taeniolatus]